MPAAGRPRTPPAITFDDFERDFVQIAAGKSCVTCREHLGGRFAAMDRDGIYEIGVLRSRRAAEGNSARRQFFLKLSPCSRIATVHFNISLLRPIRKSLFLVAPGSNFDLRADC